MNSKHGFRIAPVSTRSNLLNAVSLLVTAGGLLVACPVEAKSPESVLYSFCSRTNCPDGANPAGGLIADGAGNLDAATGGGGAHEGGAVIVLTPTGKGWSESVLYSFCSETRCTDGANPNVVTPVADSSHNLYGTTFYGGNFSCGCGTVWQVTPEGTETVLHGFAGNKDGNSPLSGLAIDVSGNLYGTTLGGGRGSCVWSENGQMVTGCGIVFKLTPNGNNTWTYTVLYKFKGGTDGATPDGTLIVDSSGNLYGTTIAGGTGTCSIVGTSGCGTVFEVSPEGKETQLYAFKGGNDGANPGQFGAGLLMSNGVIYGTTYDGGTYGAGTVFELDSNGNEAPIYSFTGGNDGANPWSGVIMDKQGNLYSTTQNGGSNGSGVVFGLAPPANGQTQWTESWVYAFCSQKNCKDGAGPHAGLLPDEKFKHLFSTAGGGAYGEGVVMSIDVKAAAKTR